MSKLRTFTALVFAAALVGAALLAWPRFIRSDQMIRRALAKEFRNALQRTPRAQHQDLFTAHLEKLGASGILDVLEDHYPQCHSQAHPLGMAVFAQTRDIHQAIAACGDRCTGGCFHGVLMAAFKDYAQPPADDPEHHLELQDVVTHAQAICKDPAITAIHRQGNCAHGIGHALMFLAEYETSQAISACRLFPERPLQYYCASGAYMERDLIHGSADTTGASLLVPCNQEEDFPAACYRYKVKYLFHPETTVAQVADLCLGLQGLQRLGCFHGLGFSQLNDVFREPSLLGATCRYGSTQDQKICIEGAIEKLADYDPRRAATACKSLAPELTAHCQQTIAYGFYSLEKPFDSYFSESQ